MSYRNRNELGTIVAALLFALLVIGGFFAFIATVLYFQFSLMIDGMTTMVNIHTSTATVISFFITLILLCTSRLLYVGTGLGLGWLVLSIPWWKPLLIFFPVLVIMFFGTFIFATLTLLGTLIAEAFNKRF
jgi:hypothetical protein